VVLVTVAVRRQSAGGVRREGRRLELIEIDPRTRPARLRELNPTNRVPVLEVDGVAIRESSAICDWLQDVHPEPSLWPADPARRAAARGLLRWVDDELTANFFLSMRLEAFGVPATEHPDVVAILRSRLVRRWATAEQLLAATAGPWLAGGEDPTLADLAALPLAMRLPSWRPDLGPDPAAQPLTSAWLEALRQRPSAAAVDRRGEPPPAA